MSKIIAAIYARVSSEIQARTQTISSQIADLIARVRADECALTEEMQFIDDGYSGQTLVRPALERLRDRVASGDVERLYVHSPDRLSRRYGYQVVLIDEFTRAGIEIVFLNRAISGSPEDELLLQVQGVVAEYERAKILERSRRGKRHKAQLGEVSVLCGAPYGYRYASKVASAGAPRYEIVPEEAETVRQLFELVGRDRVTINEATRRLNQSEAVTRDSKKVWSRATVYSMLKNPAYAGEAAYGRTRSGQWEPSELRAKRGHQWPPRNAVTRRKQPESEWIKVPVPAIIERDLFDAVQEQLTENKKRERTKMKGAKYLLQGLICCARCGYAWYGLKTGQKLTNPLGYYYYRCAGSDRYRFAGHRLCDNHPIRIEALDAAVWEKVRGILEQPDRLSEEYSRRLQQPANSASQMQREEAEKQLKKIRQAISRLIDSYAGGFLEKSEFEPRITGMKQRTAKLELRLKELVDEAETDRQLRLIIGRLDEFSARIRGGLDKMDWNEKRALIRTLVKRVEVDQDKVKVVFRVDGFKRGISSSGESLQDCLNGVSR